ncbi:MAG TPA: MFS transporter [Acidimicrobiales bacterium]|jgi:MFS family permease|nr:MFS transporter [Acidimicrobiales bacterium]
MRRLPFLRPREPNLEETEDAVLEGDVPYAAGSARAALAHRPFRLVWMGSMASNIGTWMQNVALGAFAYELTKSSGYVAMLGFAQLGPLLALSIVGGLLADTIDRRLLLVACQVEQMILSFVLAFVVAQDEPSRGAILVCVLAIGIGNALNAPTFSAVLPQLVGKRDLVGAVSLQSVQLNLSRVVGPAIGGLVLPVIGAAGVFVVNGITYVFAIVTLLMVSIPRPYPQHGEQGLRRLVGGFAVARRDRLVRRCLLTIASISFFCLPFIGLMPVLASENLGIDVKGTGYGVLYACFGLGAAAGAVAVGTLLVGRNKAKAVRAGLVIFAVMLAVFGLLRQPLPAYPVVLLVGLFYFGTVTSLSTVLQQHLTEDVRGRVMALWIMGFGGTVPIGLLVFGWVAEATSVTTVVLIGAAVALVLPLLADVREGGTGDDQSAATAGIPGAAETSG